MSDSKKPTDAHFETWCNDPAGPVALTSVQALLPIEGEQQVVFPPTFANLGYVVDDLPDGTRVALMDSVGSQANRMEPIFKCGDPGKLVPQITIKAGDRDVNLLDVGHRIADAFVRSSGALPAVKAAFEAYQKKGDATLIANLAPTTLVFGAWDSRGDAGAKLPRLVQSTIRAWGASPLGRAAQYSPPVDYSTLDVFTEEDKRKEESDDKSPIAKRGFVHVPSGRSHGGITATSITRTVTINLIALRALRAAEDERSKQLRRYVMGLALVAALYPQDGFLRQGCLLTAAPLAPAKWETVSREGARNEAKLTYKQALEYASDSAEQYGVGPSLSFDFDKAAAKKDVDEAKAEAKKKDKAKKDKAKEAGA